MIYQPTPLGWLAVLGVSFMLLSLIWLVQLLHYPTFRYIDPAAFGAFHAHHTRSISYLVAPLMVGELALAAWCAVQARGHWAWAVPLVLVLFTWANTFFVAVPLHGRLAAGFDRDVIERLIRANGWRTAAWTIKTAWVAVLFWWAGGR
jgi:hypothetical protein